MGREDTTVPGILRPAVHVSANRAGGREESGYLGRLYAAAWVDEHGEEEEEKKKESLQGHGERWVVAAADALQGYRGV